MTISNVLAREKRLTLILTGLAVLFILLLLLFGDRESRQFDETDRRKLFPDLNVADIERIEVATADDQYALFKRGEAWVLPQRADYPVREDAIEALSVFLSGAEITAKRTADTDKLDQLGLGDRSAARLSLFGSDDAVLGDKLLGARLGDVGRDNMRTYARSVGDPQSWLLSASAPPLHSALWWIDLALPEGMRAPITTLSAYSEIGETDFTLIRGPNGTVRLLDNINQALNVNAERALNALTATDFSDVRKLTDIEEKTSAGWQYALANDCRFEMALHLNATGSWLSFKGLSDACNAAHFEGRAFLIDPLFVSDFMITRADLINDTE